VIYNQPSDKRATNSGRKKPKTIEELAERDTKQFLKEMEMLAGVSAQTPMTLEEIGAVLGCTRERVRQIEKKALRKLKFRLMELGVIAGSDLIDTPYGTSDKFTKD
jgi:DNA-directed RNA polymerase sigma subunit (sigma70/sigma32)